MTEEKTDHIVVKCLHEDCAIASPLIRGLCTEHFALAVELDLVDELPLPAATVVVGKNGPYVRKAPYKPRATAFGRRAPQGAPLAFLLENVTHTGEGCLIWPYARAQNGYPEMRYAGRPARAHRVMCQLAHGDPPMPYFEASHTCERGHVGCVNPRHLVWETHAENHARRRADVRRPRAPVVYRQYYKKHPDMILDTAE